MSDDDLQIAGREQLPMLLSRLGLDGEGAEIGVATGRFSRTILEHSRLKRLYSVDLWRHVPAGYDHDAANRGNAVHLLKYLRTRLRLSGFGRRSVVWRLSGDDASRRIADASLDFVYIDANHSYQAVARDIENWWPKLRNGGIFAGHDYADTGQAFGVRQAVDEFAARVGRRLYLTVERDSLPTSWYLRK